MKRFMAIGEIRRGVGLKSIPFRECDWAETEKDFRIKVFEKLRQKYPEIGLDIRRLVAPKTPIFMYEPFVVREIKNLSEAD